jgi:hypothetical protein
MLKSKLLQKQGYGLDQSGEVVDDAQENIEDSSEPWTQHETPHNPVNMAVDTEARKEFPELGNAKTRFPARGLK